jgi:hypothetical protein
LAQLDPVNPACTLAPSLCQARPACQRQPALAHLPRSLPLCNRPCLLAQLPIHYAPSLSLATSWDPLLAPPSPRIAADHVPQLPFEPAHTRSLSPAPVRPLLPSLAFSGHRQNSPEESNAVLDVQSIRRRAKSPRASSRGEKPVPVLWLP